MGCCFSRVGEDGIPSYYKVKELVPKDLKFEHLEPLTKAEILRLRQEFWIEVLSSTNRRTRRAMRTAKRAADCIVFGSLSAAQHVIDNSKYYVPFGDLTMLVDKRGHVYLIPLYCLAFPTNMVQAGLASQ